MKSLPLFHSVRGQPVIVLGEGDSAAAKRRLVERAGGLVFAELAEGIDKGARLAFVAHADPASCESDAIRLRCAGLLVNVVDRPELCDFTTPSLIDRDPLLIAVGTGGASAGLAKAVRLRLDRLLPARLGDLAKGLEAARTRLRARWPDARDRRGALDAALEQGGALDPLDGDSANRIGAWLESSGEPQFRAAEIVLASDDPDDLTLRQTRLLGQADALVLACPVPPEILARARADALRLGPGEPVPDRGLVVTLRR
jgi:uroporphyrin-III C-methyltransferase/precorrin-2 dehydrogenase/sirohydrochlorin ferrochelatase